MCIYVYYSVCACVTTDSLVCLIFLSGLLILLDVAMYAFFGTYVRLVSTYVHYMYFGGYQQRVRVNKTEHKLKWREWRQRERKQKKTSGIITTTRIARNNTASVRGREREEFDLTKISKTTCPRNNDFMNR